MRVENTGDGTARNVVIEDTLPDGVTYVPGAATADPDDGFSETSASGDSVVWALDALGAGDAVDITVPVLPAADLATGTTLTNTASARADEATTPVADTGSFVVVDRGRRRHRQDRGRRGHRRRPRRSTYTLTAHNDGPSDALDVTVADTLPANVSFISAETPCTESERHDRVRARHAGAGRVARARRSRSGSSPARPGRSRTPRR